MGFQVCFKLSRVPIFDPEIIEVGDIRAQLNNDAVDVGVPFIIV
ncbi:unnamed protein product, partial [marine sediment metagenome]